MPLLLRAQGSETWQESGSCYAQLGFSTDHPGAVTLTCDSQPWVFDRELLTEASAHPDWLYGIGDVRVIRKSGVFEITLGHVLTDGACVHIPASTVVMFCEMVEAASPSGTDVYDVDLWLRELS